MHSLNHPVKLRDARFAGKVSEQFGDAFRQIQFIAARDQVKQLNH
jgi:hypothetical protein